MGLVTKGSKDVLLKKAKYLAQKDEEYTIKVINGNYELISELFKHKTFSDTDYTTKELTFIKSVKNYIVKNEIYLNSEFEKQFFPEDVHYIKVAKVPLGKKFEGVFEIDIDEAYWKTAHLLGIISDEIYLRGQKGNISKQARLTALGSLAKKIYYYKFKGEQLEKVSTKTDPLLQNLWFTICKRVSDVMNDCIRELGKEFIFYWVDGIYVQGKAENLVIAENIFTEYGYNVKFKKVKQVYFHEKGFSCNDFGTHTREFNYPGYSRARTKDLSYSEALELKKLAKKILNEDYDIVKGIQNEESEDT
tara:strand:- start:2070 stop:2984 length:915 start_codon:yes stop_codon:yes gene_type:complete